MIIDKLIEKGLVSSEKGDSLKKAIQSSQQKEEEVLLSENVVSEEKLFEIKSEIVNFPFKKDILPADVPLSVLKVIPKRTAENYKMIALNKTDQFLEVGMPYPEDLNAQEALKFLSRRWKLEPKIYLIKLSIFEEFLKLYGSLKEEVKEILGDEEGDKKRAEEKKKRTTIEEVKKMVEDAPVSKAVDSILQYGVQKGASDIHIEPERKKLRVRFRVLGSLESSIELPLRFHKPIVSRIKILAFLKLDEQRVPQDGRFSKVIEERNIDFRVSTFPTTLGEKVVMRILDSASGFKTFEELGLSNKDMNIVKEAIAKPYGLILATGPTGCGKSTTLYSALRELNQEDVNVVTLEDPVEYFIKGVNQSQVRPEIGYSFANGLRSVVRQDPDVIMVGEIRDQETASLAIHAALTGHIVLSTLHTNDAIGAIPRLVDLGVEPFLIPSTLSLAIAQRLVRTLCGHCKKKVEANEDERKIIMAAINGLPEEVKRTVEVPNPLYIWKPVGCRYCGGKGYTGRLGIFETFKMTDRLSEKGSLEEDSLKKEADQQGMVTMRQDGVLKALKGLTSLSEVITSTRAKEKK
jgi:type IV pilus assembly protein PilB